jgi:hypothetical protein
LINFCSTEETNDNSKPKIKAHQNPSILIPDTRLSARRIISTLITSKNIPNVTMVIGSVSIIRIGFTIAFRKARTKAKIIAVEKELITTCGSNIFESTYTTTAVSSKLTRNRIQLLLK